MNRERLSFYKDVAIVGIAAAALCYIAVRYLIGAMLPFAIAYVIAILTRRPATFLAKRTRLSERIIRPIIAILILALVLGAVGFAAYAILIEAWGLLDSLVSEGRITELIEAFTDMALGFFGRMGISEELRENFLGSLSGILTDLVSRLGGIVSSVAASVPKILLFLLVSLIATVYFSLDLDKINSSLRSVLPKRISSRLCKWRSKALSWGGVLIRSYAIIMLLTFAMIFIGLLLLGVDYALLIAFIVAVLDILPVIGIGIVLIPWSAVMLIWGNVGLGIGLLVLYLVATVVRQIAEPKILGKSLGLHPLASLALMYVGYSLFGFAGLILLPLAAVLFGERERSESATSDEENAARVE